MPAPNFDDLVGLELTVTRLAADMRMFGFGKVAATTDKHGNVAHIAKFALHLQCPWRLVNEDGIVTGSRDLWEFVGTGDEPDSWEPVSGNSLQTHRLEPLLGKPLGEGRSVYYASGHFVTSACADATAGDFLIELSSGHRLEGFPCGSIGEQWRLFSPGTGHPHFVFEFPEAS